MLTAKQERFAQEYVVDFNSSEAAIRAGYAKNSARQQGSRLLTNADIQKRVRELAEEGAQRVELTRDFVINGLMDLAQNAQAESAKVRAFELLGKHLALFTDRLEVTQIPDSSLVQSWIEALEADVNGNR